MVLFSTFTLKLRKPIFGSAPGGALESYTEIEILTANGEFSALWRQARTLFFATSGEFLDTRRRLTT